MTFFGTDPQSYPQRGGGRKLHFPQRWRRLVRQEVAHCTAAIAQAISRRLCPAGPDAGRLRLRPTGNRRNLYREAGSSLFIAGESERAKPVSCGAERLGKQRAQLPARLLTERQSELTRESQVR